ncbi:unnamed protein product [Amoebophrya sp. A120]|nr:unnamed protein product [Amoebophrya sp. A120]|eukprot:GSA120T00022161001.1
MASPRPHGRRPALAGERAIDGGTRGRGGGSATGDGGERRRWDGSAQVVAGLSNAQKAWMHPPPPPPLLE